jgi:hypothetical protein
VLWPRVADPDLRVILGNTDECTPSRPSQTATAFENRPAAAVRFPWPF